MGLITYRDFSSDEAKKCMGFSFHEFRNLNLC